MRLNIRIKIGDYTLFSMISKTQSLKGITSKVIGEEKNHMTYIFWDLENCNLSQVELELRQIQDYFSLGDIFIFSDKENSFRAFCFSKRTFLEYLHILLHTKYVDYNFFYWTVQRGYATLRTSNKINRKPQELVSHLTGYEYTEMPKNMIRVLYDTGYEKLGKVLNIG